MASATTVRLTDDELTHPRTLIPEKLFGFLTDRIAREEDIPTEDAVHVMEQALAFLVACALNPDARLSPSKQVDIGWHAFLAYTREYQDFCTMIAGRFIHHAPVDTPEDAIHDPVAAIGATVEAIRAAGLPVVPELWIPASQCSQCYAGCADDPREN
ncbi:glycine-rich domain-containing protein [Streptosporangium sp. H16]|uniref:glycine-rich domain-containing protein n=1 Tax=Streptosporangium sp. H16 TaxID=3444184 RepID=UPI003F7959AA